MISVGRPRGAVVAIVVGTAIATVALSWLLEICCYFGQPVRHFYKNHKSTPLQSAYKLLQNKLPSTFPSTTR